MMSRNRFLATADDVATTVRAERAALRMTQAELAEKAGVSRKFLIAIEQGHPRAELDKVLAILHALDIHALALPSVPTGKRFEDLDPDEVMASYGS
ncbi:MAG: helix-turn-helix domain-containing protein [Propionibacteriaceae bacterium]|jgi:HTH-type transcriptional regulator/antitoxin HipB|nr:helix-turn-helix domain-containing protein [Propionibacteriaceae bacterium]